MGKKITNLIFTVIVLIVILAAFFPIAKSYYDTYPPIGDDFYHTFSQVQYFLNNFTWPHLSWKYIWYFGGPSLIGYPWLNFYGASFLVRFLGLYPGVILYYLGGILLYGWLCYFLFKKLSSSRFTALGLAIAIMWSTSTWILFFRSSFALAFNQMFLPLAIFLILKYQESNKKKFLFLSALVIGLSFLAQSGSAIPFLSPSLLILLIFWWSKKDTFWQWKKKIIDTISFLLIVFFISLFYLYSLVANFASQRADTTVFDWMRQDAFAALYNKTNIMILGFFIFLLLSVLITRRLKEIKKALPFLMVFLYIIVFNIFTVTGHNPFGTDFPPNETWYIYSFLLVCFCAIFWQALEPVIKKYFRRWLIGLIKISLLLIFITPFGLFGVYNFLGYFKLHNPEYSCAPEDSLHKAVIKNDYTEINKAFPEWFPKDDKNWRYFPLSACMYLWWNAINKMPLPTGYALILRNKLNIDYINRAGEVFNGSLAAKNPDLDPNIIRNNALFFLDWMGVGFIENFESPYTKDPEIVELGKEPEAYRVLPVKKNITSPIIKSTNVPSILIVSSSGGFDTMVHVLAQENLNSRYLIPVNGSLFIDVIDDLLKEDLEDFDAILLYDYQYQKEKSFKKYPQEIWERLADYVKNGGKLIIETGSEVKESDIKNLPNINVLPEVFPIERTSWGDLGSDWELSYQEDFLLEGVNLEELPPLIYNGDPWKLSYSSQENVRDWAKVILSQREKPILVQGKLGEGEVIWSGITLPYLIKSYNNFETSKLFRNILEELVNLEDESTLPVQVERFKSEQIEIKGRDFKGVLFKENYNSGWQAKIKDRNLKIYPAGLNFMYFKVPSENKEEKEELVINLNYRGEFKLKIMFYLSLITVLYILFYSAGGHRFQNKFIRILRINKLKRKIKKWWAKEEI